MKKAISILLSLTILLSLITSLDFSAYAADLPSSGSCGNGVSYTFNIETGYLHISGSGAMTNYSSSNHSPFYNQSVIKSVTVEEGVTTIGNFSFDSCSELACVSVPSTATTIGNGAFLNCTSINKIVLPSGVTTIGKNTVMTGKDVFKGCSGLKSVYIPKTVMNIYNGSFDGCSSLSKVMYEGDENEWGQISIGSNNNSCLTDASRQYNVSVAPDIHSYNGGVITVNPSCTTGGEKKYTCQSCGDEKIETIEATGHVIVVDEANEATCTEDGKTQGSHCSVCGEIMVPQEITQQAFGHDYNEESVSPTCTEQGYTKHICTRCGESYNDTYINETGHSLNCVTVPPSVLDGGYNHCTCSKCDYSFNDNYTEPYVEDGERVKASELKAGDVVQLGMYPQSLVEDEETINALNTVQCSMTKMSFLWKRIYSWDSSDGNNVTPTGPSKYIKQLCYADSMRYADIEYNGTKYRKIVIDKYRPISFEDYHESDNSAPTNWNGTNRIQIANGYELGTYYFKWEPVIWIYKYADRYASNNLENEITLTANKILTTSMDISSNELFNATEKTIVKTEPKNMYYQPNSTYYRGRGTDYAKCLGLKVYEDSFSPYWLRDGYDESGERPVYVYEDLSVRFTPDDSLSAIAYQYHTYQYIGNRPVIQIDKNAEVYRLFVNSDLYDENCITKNGVVFNSDLTELIKLANPNIEEFVIPSTVSIIDDNAFSGCNVRRLIVTNNDLSIKKIIEDLPDDVTVYAYADSNAANAATVNGLNIVYLDNYNCNLGNHLASMYGIESYSNPTCTHNGSTAHFCVLCNQLANEEYNIPALGHQLDEGVIINEPTCTESGLRRYSCSVCGDTIDEPLDPTGHNWDTGTTITFPTCDTDGLRRFACSTCGATYDMVLNKRGHSFVETTDGCVKHITCSNTDERLLDKKTYPESEHDYSAKTNQTWNYEYPGATSLELVFSSETETEPDYDNVFIYNSNGEQVGKYSGSQLASQTITIDGDSFSIKFVTDEENQMFGFSLDSIVATMPQCDYYSEETNHEYVESTNVAATCTEDGYIVYCCSKCGTETTEITPATGHSNIEISSIPSTCTVAGQKTYRCSVCGTETIEELPLIPHNYEITEQVNATELHSGYKVYTCSMCGEQYTEVLPPLNIGDYEFNILDNGTAEIVKYNGNSAEIEIPSVYNGYTVTKISNEAFKNCTCLTKVTIPDTVTTIGNSAFMNCSEITDLSIPCSYTDWNSSWFSGCNKIERIVLTQGCNGIMGDFTGIMGGNLMSYQYTPWYVNRNTIESVILEEGIKSIGKNAFLQFPDISKIHLPNSLQTIDEWAFWGSKGDTAIPNNITFFGDSAFLNAEITQLCAGGTIGDHAFSCTRVETVTINDGTEIIGSNAFNYCPNLETVYLPASITAIEQYAFAYNNNISDVYYSGTQQEWEAIDFTEGNEPLLNATIHYNYVYGTVDDSALIATIEKAQGYDSDDYSEESLAELNQLLSQYATISSDNSTQEEIDAAVYDILTAISNLDPYLNLVVKAENGTVNVSALTKSEKNNKYSILFGNVVSLTATSDDGYDFVGWYETISSRVLSYDETYSFKITANTNIEAKFVPSKSASIYFMNDSGYIAAIVTKAIEEWKAISSIETLLPEVPYKYGSRNGRWSYVESSVLRNLRKGADVDIIAVYDDIYDRPDIPYPTDNTPALSLFYSLDENNNVGSFIMSAGIPDGCEVESVGIAFYYKKAADFNPKGFEVTINNKMLTSKFEASNESGHYTVDVKKFSNTYNWAVRGYVTYYDGDGNLKTAYTNQVNIVDRQQV